MSAITGTRIDEVLQHAVESGTMPNVVATRPTRTGRSTRARSGPGGRRAGPGDVDTLFRIASMTKMVTTVAALQLVGATATWTSTRRCRSTGPSSRTCRCSTASTGTSRGCAPPASTATVRQLVTHTSGLRLLVLERRHRALGGVTGTANMLAGDARHVHRAAGGRPRHEASSTASTPTGSAAWSRRPPARSWTPTSTSTSSARSAWSRPRSTPPTSSARTCPRCTCAASDGRWEATDVDWNAAPDYWAGGHGLYCPPQRVPALPADAARQRHARRHEDPRGEDGRGRVHQPDRRPRLARGDRDGRATDDRRLQRGPGLQVRPRPAAQHRGHSGHARAPAAAPGRASSTRTSGWTGRPAISGAIYTQTLPFVEPAVFQVYIDFEKALYASL